MEMSIWSEKDWNRENDGSCMYIQTDYDHKLFFLHKNLHVRYNYVQQFSWMYNILLIIINYLYVFFSENELWHDVY